MFGAPVGVKRATPDAMSAVRDSGRSASTGLGRFAILAGRTPGSQGGRDIKVAERMGGLPRIGLDIMGDLADEQDSTGTGAEPSFRLENADSDIPPPENAVRATRETVGEDAYNSWLPLVGLRELRQAVADSIRRDDDLDYDWSSEVIITNGVQEGLLSTLLALLDPGDGVITPEPAYSGIINRIRLAHGVPLFVPLREKRGWRLDLDALERQGAEASAKAIVLNATNMPTGVLYTWEELDAIADLARRRDLWVVYSAVTSRLTFDIDRAPNIATWPGMRERTIILDGVSKDFNMTAWRIGWAVADKAVIEHVGKAHMYNGTLTSAFAQAGVIALLNDRDGAKAYLRRCASILAERGRLAADGLNAVPGLSCVPPEGGWWFLLDHRELEADDAAFARALLEQTNVAVTPMGTWGPSTAMGHVRIIFANEPADRLREAVSRIGRVAAGLAR